MEFDHLMLLHHMIRMFVSCDIRLPLLDTFPLQIFALNIRTNCQLKSEICGGLYLRQAKASHWTSSFKAIVTSLLLEFSEFIPILLCSRSLVSYTLLQTRSPKPFSESFLISSIIPCISVSIRKLLVFDQILSHLRHYRYPIFSFHIAKGHFRAFILVDTEFWVIDIGDLV
jgi:hypothetical protein